MSAPTRDFVTTTTLASEMASFSSPADKPELSPAVKVGDHFPESDQLPQLQNLDGRPVLLTFLRHCGCPFAEKTFQSFRTLCDSSPDVRFIAISHSSQEDTDEWVVSVGGTGDVEIVVDPQRTLYAKWGLGFSSYWANIGPVTLWKAIKLGQEELIYNRPTKSGYRWQTAGSFAIDGTDGTVQWAHVSQNAPDVANFEDGMRAVGKALGKHKRNSRQ
ncbi:hypothetical protein H072_5400 [Dactylellina haptotyla CBS 200.50]|uniref:Thioredoxin domain-containing protein n=1 Tax=Dactylellina haptotyla (strain CBS 200.50) TaxID=1284197 RepID=S8AHT1_DACHA|nr:hypothetical protein H072_5400 [Dactylellina haptotyla CBS 200.50]